MTQNFRARILRVLGVCIVALALTAWAVPAQASNIVLNGSFETGDFTNWTLGGNTGFTGVQCPGLGSVPDGSCDAFFGPVGSNGTLTQILPTVAGNVYTITFDLQTDGGNPSFFSAAFGSTTLMSVTNPSASAFLFHSFIATATSNTTALTFTFRDDPGFIFLDAVTVAPEPSSVILLGTGVLAVARLRRKLIS